MFKDWFKITSELSRHQLHEANKFNRANPPITALQALGTTA
jgi:hypothetical protein